MLSGIRACRYLLIRFSSRHNEGDYRILYTARAVRIQDA